MFPTGFTLRRILSAVILLGGALLQMNCSGIAAGSAHQSTISPSNPACFDDGIGCGTPELGAVNIGGLINALPAQTAASMYHKVQQAELKVDRLGTYWDWFMDQNGNYNPANPYLQQLDAQIAADLINGVIPEFLLGTEADNHMPGLQGPGNLPDWNYYPNQTAALNALGEIFANLVGRFPTVRYWELFNEMDSPGFSTLFTGVNQATCPIQRGQLYGEMLNLVVPSARGVNPGIHILMGGVAGAGDVLEISSFSSACGISPDFDAGLLQTMADFVTGIYNAGAGPQFDIVNAHAYADASYGYGDITNIGIAERFAAISTSLHQVALVNNDSGKQFWVTETGTSSAEDIASGTCAGNSSLGPCIDQAQVSVLGNVVNGLMTNRPFDVAIIYAISPGAGGIIDSSYDAYLPPGLSVNDYGYQMIRSDDVTLRPMFNWLMQRSSCISQGGSMFTTNWSCQH
jgi:hypothetical protein